MSPPASEDDAAKRRGLRRGVQLAAALLPLLVPLQALPDGWRAPPVQELLHFSSSKWRCHAFVVAPCPRGGLLAAPRHVGRAASAAPLSFERSVFVSIDIGANLDLDTADRSPEDAAGARPEAYGTSGFHVGITGGFRFDERWGVEGGWHEAQHRADEDWGSRARYMYGHLALRAALPLGTRQTPLLKLGAAAGRFTYGVASIGQIEENGALVAGPLVGAAVEHELTLGLAVALGVTYMPLFRKGMPGRIVLERVTDAPDGAELVEDIDSKDFTRGTVVHILTVTASFQLDWIWR